VELVAELSKGGIVREVFQLRILILDCPDLGIATLSLNPSILVAVTSIKSSHWSSL
jgi:hypothetical protein